MCPTRTADFAVKRDNCPEKKKRIGSCPSAAEYRIGIANFLLPHHFCTENRHHGHFSPFTVTS